MASEAGPKGSADSAGEPAQKEAQEAQDDPGPLELEILFGSEDQAPRDDRETKA